MTTGGSLMPDEKHWTPDMLDSETDNVHTDPGGARPANTARNQEPLRLTLAEAMQRVADTGAWRLALGNRWQLLGKAGGIWHDNLRWEPLASIALGVTVVARDDTAELVAADPCQEMRDAVDSLKARIHEIAVAGLASSPRAVVVQAMARDLGRLVGMEES